MILSRRLFLRNLSLICAAPAIVKAASLMPVRVPAVVDNFYDIIDLLSQRIDAAHEALASNMAESLYGNHGESAIALANLTGEPVKVAGIADASYVRSSSYERISGLFQGGPPPHLAPLYDRKEMVFRPYSDSCRAFSKGALA